MSSLSGKKKNLVREIRDIGAHSERNEYEFTPIDYIALGYIAGRYCLDSFHNDNGAARHAVKKYSQQNDLGLPYNLEELLTKLKVI